jgi:hypothetical protein
MPTIMPSIQQPMACMSAREGQCVLQKAAAVVGTAAHGFLLFAVSNGEQDRYAPQVSIDV